MKRFYCLKILLILFFLFSLTTICLSQDSLDPHFTPSWLTFKQEKRRLDIAAKMFKEGSNKVIVLITQSPKRSKILATRRLKESKRYLIRKYNIPSEKINTVYAGVYEEFQMRIFISDADDFTVKNPD